MLTQRGPSADSHALSWEELHVLGCTATAAGERDTPPQILTCWYYAERKCCLDRREDGICVPPSVHLGPEKQPVGHLSYRAISPNTYHTREKANGWAVSHVTRTHGQGLANTHVTIRLLFTHMWINVNPYGRVFDWIYRLHMEHMARLFLKYD